MAYMGVSISAAVLPLGEKLALNQTHSGMLQLRCLGVVHVCNTIA